MAVFAEEAVAGTAAGHEIRRIRQYERKGRAVGVEHLAHLTIHFMKVPVGTDKR